MAVVKKMFEPVKKVDPHMATFIESLRERDKIMCLKIIEEHKRKFKKAK